MTLQEFHAAMRVLVNIDGFELMETRMFTKQQAEGFLANPWQSFIQLSDEKAAAVWKIVERRMERRAAA